MESNQIKVESKEPDTIMNTPAKSQNDLQKTSNVASMHFSDKLVPTAKETFELEECNKHTAKCDTLLAQCRDKQSCQQHGDSSPQRRDHFSEHFLSSVLYKLRDELSEKRDEEICWDKKRSLSLSSTFPSKSAASSRLEDWLLTRIRHGFTRNCQAQYTVDLSYEEEEESIIFEEGVYRIFDPYYCLEQDEILSVDGSTDKQGYPRGRGNLTTTTGDDLCGFWKGGVRNGVGKTVGDNCARYGLALVQGHYVDGILHGFGKGKLTSGLYFEGLFNNGYLEGPVVGVPDKTNTSKEFHHLSYQIAIYNKGLPSGYIWQMLEGGGWIYGKVDEKGHLTGDDIMYIYPDLFTCLLGKFKNGTMEEARLSYVEDTDWAGDILLVLPHRGVLSPDVFRYSPSSSNGFTLDKMVQDPYERVRCIVGESFIPGAGLGLFARVDIQAGEVVSFYHGLWYPYGTRCQNANYDYQIFLDWTKTPKSDYLDIPPDCTDTEVYRASLGHKINHCFNPNCEFMKLQHPTFGSQVLGVRALRDIYCGEEFTVNYRYEIRDAPDWFQSLYLTL